MSRIYIIIWAVNSSHHLNIIIFDYILFVPLCIHDYMNTFTHLHASSCLQSPHTYYTINNFLTVFSCFILVFHLNIIFGKNIPFFFFFCKLGGGQCPGLDRGKYGRPIFNSFSFFQISFLFVIFSALILASFKPDPI